MEIRQEDIGKNDQGISYNISSKQESLGSFESVDSSTLQDLKERLKDVEERSYNLNRDIGSLATKMEGWEKWKWVIIAAVASPLIISIGNSIFDLTKK